MINSYRPPNLYGDLRIGTDVVRSASRVLQSLPGEDRDQYHPEAIQHMQALGRTLIQAGEGIITACNHVPSPDQGTLFDPDKINRLHSVLHIVLEARETGQEAYEQDCEEAA